MDRARLATDVTTLLETDADVFESRVDEEATQLKAAVRGGDFDNAHAQLGLEYELYGSNTDTLARVPPVLFDLTGFERELCRHQAELSTNPQPVSEFGIDAQEAEVRARLDAALNVLDEGMSLVSDGLWTIPPDGDSAGEYLTRASTMEGVTLAHSVSDIPRYHAQGNCGYPSLRLRLPNVRDPGRSVALNGLCTSIQPHYQVRRASDLPSYFRYALRIAGPLLALGVNAPFVPPDFYAPDADANTVLDDSWQETRIRVFESVMNPEGEREAVRFPCDIESVEEAIDRIAESETVVPALFDDEGFAHFQHKHASYWRWVRPVFDDHGKNARIEFRPLPAQPTVRDTMAFVVAFAGLLEGLQAVDHPVRALPWETARENFYAAAREGLDADLTWITADGSEIGHTDRIFEDLFAHASSGLRRAGISETQTERYLEPLRARVENRLTPARWKRTQVERRLKGGRSLAAAIEATQQAYIRHQQETLLSGDFTDWWTHEKPASEPDTLALGGGSAPSQQPQPTP